MYPVIVLFFWSFTSAFARCSKCYCYEVSVHASVICSVCSQRSTIKYGDRNIRHCKAALMAHTGILITLAGLPYLAPCCNSIIYNPIPGYKNKRIDMYTFFMHMHYIVIKYRWMILGKYLSQKKNNSECDSVVILIISNLVVIPIACRY